MATIHDAIEPLLADRRLVRDDAVRGGSGKQASAPASRSVGIAACAFLPPLVACAAAPVAPQQPVRGEGTAQAGRDRSEVGFVFEESARDGRYRLVALHEDGFSAY